MDTPLLSHLSVADYELIYEPSEDSFLLIDALEQDLPQICSINPLVCVEIGSGSGVVITAIAKALGSSTFCIGVDVNSNASLITKRTAQVNKTEVEVISMDLMTAFQWNRKIDILIFNPPYVVTPSEEVLGQGSSGNLARAWAGGERGREVMDRLFPMIPDLLSDCGFFFLLVIKDNCPEDIEQEMKKHRLEMKIVCERKIRGEHLLVLKFYRSYVQQVVLVDVE